MKTLPILLQLISIIMFSSSETVQVRVLQQQPFQNVGINQIAFLPSSQSNLNSRLGVIATNINSFQFTQLPKIEINSGKKGQSNNPNEFISVINTESSTAPLENSNYLTQTTNASVLPWNNLYNDSVASSPPENQKLSQKPNTQSSSWFSDFNDNSFSSFNNSPLQSLIASNDANSTKSQAVEAKKNNETVKNNNQVQAKTNDSIVNQKFPYCEDYSDNQCWACVPGYLLNLIIQKCVAYVKVNTVVPAPISTTLDIASQPGQAQDNCDVYDQESKNCKECIRNYYLDSGKKSCQPVDALCRTYQQNTGKCTSCYTKYKLNAAGRCLLA